MMTHVGPSQLRIFQDSMAVLGLPLASSNQITSMQNCFFRDRKAISRIWAINPYFFPLWTHNLISQRCPGCTINVGLKPYKPFVSVNPITTPASSSAMAPQPPGPPPAFGVPVAPWSHPGMHRRLRSGASDKIVAAGFALSVRSSDPNPEGAVRAGLAPPWSREEKLCLQTWSCFRAGPFTNAWLLWEGVSGVYEIPSGHFFSFHLLSLKRGQKSRVQAGGTHWS